MSSKSLSEVKSFWEDVAKSGDVLTNARSIAREKLSHLDWLLTKFKKNPSSLWAQQIEKETGVDVDFSDGDWGNGPRGGR